MFLFLHLVRRYSIVLNHKNVWRDMEMTEIKREPWVDVIKGIAILLVVFGHVIEACQEAVLLNGSLNLLMKSIYNIIYSFHMPLFFFVSGYLFSKTTLSNTTKAKVSIANFALLYLIYSFLFLTMRLVMSSNLYSEVSIWHFVTLPIKPIGFLWYLWVLTIYYILFSVFNFKRLSIKYQIIIVVGLNVAINIANSIFSVPSQVYLIFYYIIFFWTGILFTNFKGITILNIYLYTISAFAGLLVLILVLNCEHNIKNIPIVNTAVALLIVGIIIYYSYSREIRNKYLEYIGKNSLTIYVFHPFFVTACRIVCFKLHIMGITSIVVMIAIGVCTPLVIVDVSKKLGLYNVLFKPIYLFDKKVSSK